MLDRSTTTGSARDSLLVDGALFAVVLMWGSAFTLFKIAWNDIDPVAFTGLRFALMVPFALVILALSKSRVPVRRVDVPLLVWSGIVGYFLYQLGFVMGLERTSALASAILISTHPIFSVVFTWILGRERPNRVAVAGVLLGFLGVAVFLEAWSALSAARPGDLLSLGAAAAFGAYGVINQPLTRRYPWRELMAYSLCAGGTLVAVVGIPAMVQQDWASVGGAAWLILAYSVVGPVYLAYALWNWAIRERGVTRTVVFGFLVPVVGGVLAVATLHDHMGPAQVAGAALVVAGLVVTRVGQRPREAGAPLPPAVEERAAVSESGAAASPAPG